jgi:HlyD family secretion protein
VALREWFGLRRWSKRSIGLLALLALLIGIGAIVWFRSAAGRPQYRTQPVERGEIVASISATGTLNAVTTVQVGSQISGMIKELYADFNSRVEKGQIIARIDPAIFEAKVTQAKAEVENAKEMTLLQRAAMARTEADLLSAKANQARATVSVQDAKIKRDSRSALFEEGGISREERDSAQATYDSAVAQLEAAAASVRAAEAQLGVARAQLKAAEAAVRQKDAALRAAQVDLDHTFIRAPVNGVVIARSVDVGQTVAASLQAPTLFLIAEDLTKMQVDTSVDEADISRVQLEQEVAFTVDAFPGEPFSGHVVQIRQAPIVQQNVVTYNVVVTVANPDLRLKPGLTANVKILVNRRANALKIPNAALRFRPPSPDGVPLVPVQQTREASHIWILEDGSLKRVPVTLGVNDENFTEVVEGQLKEGQRVVVGLASRNESRRSQPGSGPFPQQQRRGPRV